MTYPVVRVEVTHRSNRNWPRFRCFGCGLLRCTWYQARCYICRGEKL